MIRSLKLGTLFFVLSHFSVGEASDLELKPSSALLLAESSSREAFDPFIDYTEFQDNITEQQSINFFQSGRSLSISTFGGYESITLTMRELYGDSFSFFGLGISFFLDLNYALQVSFAFPHSHFNSITQTNHTFSMYGLDFKYYLNRQDIVKGMSFFNPYVIFSIFSHNINPDLTSSSAPRSTALPIISAVPTSQALTPTTPSGNNSPLSQEERRFVSAHQSYGVKIGAGIEIPIIKQSFMGIEMAYYYTNLLFENEDLSNTRLAPTAGNPYITILDRLLIPPSPRNLQGNRFFGDMFNTAILLGVNF